MNKQRAKRNRERKGIAAVEFAMVLPVFMAMMLGIVEFGRAMMVGQLVTNAAREGARQSIIDGSSNSQVEQQIKDFLQDTLNITDPASVLVTITVTPAPGNDDPGNEVAFAQPRDLCKVEVSIPYNLVSFLPLQYLDGESFVGDSSMRHE